VNDVDDPEKLTPERYEVLKLVSEISRKSPFRVAPVQELIDIITSKRDIKSGAVRKMVWELSKDGYLENPLRGCWRLTEKGRELLKEVEGGGDS